MWMTVNVDQAKVQEMVGWHGPVGRSTARLARMVVIQQRISAPKRTGRLAASIRWRRLYGPRGIAFSSGSNLAHARWMEKGTRPHMIYPKRRGGMLVFFWPKVGHVVHLRSVRHPGTRPYNYLMNGMRRALRAWQRTG